MGPLTARILKRAVDRGIDLSPLIAHVPTSTAHTIPSSPKKDRRDETGRFTKAMVTPTTIATRTNVTPLTTTVTPTIVGSSLPSPSATAIHDVDVSPPPLLPIATRPRSASIIGSTGSTTPPVLSSISGDDGTPAASPTYSSPSPPALSKAPSVGSYVPTITKAVKRKVGFSTPLTTMCRDDDGFYKSSTKPKATEDTIDLTGTSRHKATSKAVKDAKPTLTEEQVNDLVRDIYKKYDIKQHTNKKYYNSPAMRNVHKLRKHHVPEITSFAVDSENCSNPDLKNRAKPGHVYVYKGNLKTKLRKCDQEKWETNGYNTTRFIADDKGKTYRYNLKGDPSMKKCIYYFPKNNLSVVHYYEANENRMTRKVRKINPKKAPTVVAKKVHTSSSSNSSSSSSAVEPRFANKPDIKSKKFTDHYVATPQLNINNPLSNAEMRKIIDEHAITNRVYPVSNAMISQPEGGDIYVFKLNIDRSTNDYKHMYHDGHRWLKKGHKQPPIHLKGRLHYYPYKFRKGTGQGTDASFKKTLYITQKLDYGAVHYLGDSAVTRNRKPYGKPHPTIPTRIAHVDPEGEKRPMRVHKELTMSTHSEGIAKMMSDPNILQVRYYQHTFRENAQLKGDEIQNVRHLAQYMGDDYIRMAMHTPNVQVICANKETIEEFKRVVDIIEPEVTIKHNYDTTFEHSNRYISVLSYRHPLLERKKPEPNVKNKEPIVPLVTFIHETRSLHDHKTFLFHANEMVKTKAVEAHNKVFISDEEFKDILNWKNTTQVYCWNHEQKNVEHKAKKLGFHLHSDAMRNVKADINRFLKHETVEDYIQDKENTFANAKHWNDNKGKALAHYFDKRKDMRFRESCGAWKLAELGIENPSEGITNNPAESLNNQLAQFKAGRGRSATSLHEAVLEMYYFEKSVQHQIDGAYYNNGPFKLKDQFVHLQKDPANLPSTFVYNPRQYQKKLNDILDPKSEDGLHILPASRPPTTKLDHCQSMAKEIVENNQFQVFQINDKAMVACGMGTNIHTVNLEERTCTCQSRDMCPHVLAALKVTNVAPNYVLPNLHRGKTVAKSFYKTPTRTRRSDIHGTKRPTKHDLDSKAIHPPTHTRKWVTKSTDTAVTPKHKTINKPKRWPRPGAAPIDIAERDERYTEQMKWIVRENITNEDWSTLPKIQTDGNPFLLANSEDGPFYSANMVTQGRAVIFTNDQNCFEDENFKTVEKNVAVMASHKAKFDYDKEHYVIDVATALTDQHVVDAANSMKKDDMFRDVAKTFDVSCDCGIPCFPDAANKDCEKCHKTFHEDCLPLRECDPCQTDFQGVEWQAGYYQNTCAIDPYLNMVADHTLHEDRTFLDAYENSSNQAEQEFAKAVRLAMDNKSAEAQQLYGDFLKAEHEKHPFFDPVREHNDLYGASSELLWDKMDTTTTLTQRSTCNGTKNKPCTEPEIFHPVKIMYLENYTVDDKNKRTNVPLQDAMGKVLYDEAKEVCIPCNRGRPSNLPRVMRTTHPKQQIKETEPAKTVHFGINHGRYKYSKAQAMNAPYEIHVGKETYIRKGIQIHGQEHFAMIYQRNNNKWLAYDGARLHKIRGCIRADVHNTAKEATVLTYLHKPITNLPNIFDDPNWD